MPLGRVCVLRINLGVLLLKQCQNLHWCVRRFELLDKALVRQEFSGVAQVVEMCTVVMFRNEKANQGVDGLIVERLPLNGLLQSYYQHGRAVNGGVLCVGDGDTLFHTG